MDILTAAFFAGTVAIAVTVAIERFGGRIGGLLATLPSTIVPASVGILESASTIDDFRAAMFMTPVGMLINGMFLWSWRALPPRLPRSTIFLRLGMMLICSLTIWLGLAIAGHAAVDAVGNHPNALLIVGAAGTLCLIFIGWIACRNNPPAPAGRRPVGAITLLSRGTLAASAIGCAVAIASLNPLAAGLAATFPAIFLTTMVSLWLSQGEAVQAGAVGPMMLGSGSVSAFAVLSAWTLPLWGPVGGTVTAWVLAVVCVTTPAWLWLQRRSRATLDAG